MIPKSPRYRAERISLILLSLCLVSLAAWAAEVFQVVEREAAIRARKRPYGSRLAVVHETDEVEVLSKEPPWYRVKWKDVEGWLHESAVTRDPKVVFSSGAVASKTRATQQSAGGRGFNREVEERYRKDHPNLEEVYKVLGLIEERVTPEEQLESFLKEGQLPGAASGDEK